VDVEATTVIRQAEVLAAKHMIGRSMERFNLYPARIMGDSAYGSADMLGWLVHDQGIEPHVTVFDSPRAKTAPSHGTTSPTTMSATSILAPKPAASSSDAVQATGPVCAGLIAKKSPE
jgi:hypothetical protein